MRALRRVDELLRQLGSAAEVLGDAALAALAKAAGDKVGAACRSRRRCTCKMKDGMKTTLSFIS